MPPDDLFVTRVMRMFEAKDVAAHLHLDAALAARHDDPAGAVESVRSLFNLGRVFGRDPLDHSYQWGMGCDEYAAHGLARALAVAELPDADLAGLADNYPPPPGRVWRTPSATCGRSPTTPATLRPTAEPGIGPS